jgi:fido (protein-threonine AMPylation protein)
VPRPAWNDDWPGDLARIQQNAAALIRSIAHKAHDWSVVAGADEVLDWHIRLYQGCRVPVAGYVGHFRGDPAVKELVGYEVGVGRLQPDGLPEKVGVYSKDLAVQIPTLIAQIQAGIRQLDSALEPGLRPVTSEAVEAVVLLAARVHGEWVRLHPFANGNGRTARVWANFVALRYSLPAFVSVKPRPADAAYRRAGQASMGRPPYFIGDNGPVTALFARMLAESLASRRT